MKVGTDAVLLGAWCSIKKQASTILDIGAGTGILSLMMAQRCEAQTIDAVEVNENAYEQAVDNFEQSVWSDRLFCYHSDFKEFAVEIISEQETYDLIISNPPFYTETFKTKDEARNNARFTSSLPFEDLIRYTSKILSKNGIFSVIVPFKEKEQFEALAKNYALFLSRICYVKGKHTSEVKRVLMEFSFNKSTVFEEELTIELERHQYTEAYINLTKDFYLNM